eukprot:TRINITY_DN81630_c0_g1_i1.p1 TRINITY_DN81630_c0_g1~~TRINITY_DN81630_c0_g1_i1.p1  ORF type:complete len:296 (+),score=132.88 TRINITY_DN81630_c0_g1_i1:112-999(+)
MLAGYDSDEEEDAEAQKPTEDDDDSDEDENMSSLPSFARREEVVKSKDETEAAEEVPEEAPEDEGDADDGGAQDEEQLVEAREEDEDEEEEEEEDEESDDSDEAGAKPKPLPSAGKVFQLIDQKDLEKFKPTKPKVVVESFKKKPKTRQLGSGNAAAKAKAAPGVIVRGSMQAGLINVPKPRSEFSEFKAQIPEKESEETLEHKKAALQALGLIEGGDGGAPPPGKGKKRKGEDDDVEAAEKWKKDKSKIDQASVPLRTEMGDAAGKKKMPKGHILGLASAELERQKEHGRGDAI